MVVFVQVAQPHRLALQVASSVAHHGVLDSRLHVLGQQSAGLYLTYLLLDDAPGNVSLRRAGF